MKAAYSPEQKLAALSFIKHFGGMTEEALFAIRAALESPGLSKSTIHDWWKKSGLQIDPRTAEPNETEHPNQSAEIPVRKPKKSVVPVASQPFVLPIPNDKIDEINASLDIMFERAARAYLVHAIDQNVVKDTKGKDAVMAAAIAVDKMRLLRNLPTEIIQVLPDLLSELDRHGLSASDVFNSMIAQLRSAKINVDGE